jgi:hypothetical protein
MAMMCSGVQPVPRFSKVRGTLNCSESGLSVNNMRLRWLGADARLDGGLRFNDSVDAGPTRLSFARQCQR